MLVYPNNLNYLHNNRAYFRIILGKNGITSMALCGYPLTSAPILSYSRKIGDEKIVEENSWFRLDKTFNISTVWLHSDVKKNSSEASKWTGIWAGELGPLKNDPRHLYTSRQYSILTTHSLTGTLLKISVKAPNLKKLNDNWRRFWRKSQIYWGA